MAYCNDREAQDRCDDRDEICVDLEPAEKTPDDLALQEPGNNHSGGEKCDEGDQSKDSYLVLADVKERLLQERYVHVLV